MGGVMGTIDKVRELRETFYYRTKGVYRVIVLDECHRLSKAAQSALLKVVEEAPDGIFFIWSTTDVDDIIHPIRSRSLLLQYGIVPPEETMRSLNYIINAKQIQISDECKKLIVSRAHGHMRDAHMLLDLYCLIGAEKFPEVVQSSVSIFARYFMSIYNKNKDLVLKCVEELSSFPMASLKSDSELFVFGLVLS